MKWQSMGSRYSGDELASMQKDAMERVREMQRRADETLRRSNASLNPPPPPPVQDPPPCPPEVSPQNPLPMHSAPSAGKLGNILSAAGIDQDRIVILALLLILYNDGADQLLLLALLYLFL